jgi:hypothetical protein
MRRTSSILGLALVGVIASGAVGLAETVSFKADLKGANERPATNSVATGTVSATYDTSSKTFKWALNYSGLTGNPTGAHFVGPPNSEKTPANPPEVVGILLSPLQGSAKLSDAQGSDLMADRWSFNIETAAYPKGEIQGKLQKAK